MKVFLLLLFFLLSTLSIVHSVNDDKKPPPGKKPPGKLPPGKQSSLDDWFKRCPPFQMNDDNVHYDNDESTAESESDDGDQKLSGTERQVGTDSQIAAALKLEDTKVSSTL